MINHFDWFLTSPKYIALLSNVYSLLAWITMYYLQIIDVDNFFAWGPPFKIFGRDVTSQTHFYILICIIFMSQLFSRLQKDVIDSWRITCVQNPKGNKLFFNESNSLIILNLDVIYREIEVVLVISQISFLFIRLASSLLITNIVNKYYINKKRDIRSPDLFTPFREAEEYLEGMMSQC